MSEFQDSPVQLSFERIEKKYLLTEGQYRRLRQALDPYMQKDRFGLYTIENVYFDTPDCAMIRYSLDGPVYKEKFRVRSYGTPGADQRVFAEIKKKFNGVVYKRRIGLMCRELPAFLSGAEIPGADRQIQAELHWLLRSRELSPRCFIGYDRTALAGKEDPSLRITFDRNLRWRPVELALEKGDWGDPVLDEDRVVMEVKFPRSAPLWLSALMTEAGVFPVSFSKYGACYTGRIALGAAALRRVS